MRWVTAGLAASAALVAPWVLIVAASEAFGPAPTAPPEQARAASEAARVELDPVPLALETPGSVGDEVPEEPARPAPLVLSETPLEEARPAAVTVAPSPPVEVVTPLAVATRPPVPTATRVAARGNSAVLTPAEIYALTLEVSGDANWATWATRVIACESGGRVNAISPGGHYGLGQVASGHPYDFSRMISEPRYAVEAMLAIYRASGPGAWSCK